MLAGVLKIVMASLPVSWYGDMFYMLGLRLYPLRSSLSCTILRNLLACMALRARCGAAL